MIWRDERWQTRVVQGFMNEFGVRQEKVFEDFIPGGWDICPVCVKRSEWEYGASR